jgi:hypothetical protein
LKKEFVNFSSCSISLHLIWERPSLDSFVSRGARHHFTQDFHDVPAHLFFPRPPYFSLSGFARFWSSFDRRSAFRMFGGMIACKRCSAFS